MSFYSVYGMSSSIIQGIGNPRIPMYVLLVGAVITIVSGYILIPIYGIVGAALASTIASFLMMIPMIYYTTKLTKVNLPYKFLTKVLIASIVMALPAFILPDTHLGLIIGIILGIIIYFVMILVLKTLSNEDVNQFRGFASKLGPLSNPTHKFLNFAEKYTNNDDDDGLVEDDEFNNDF